MSANKTKLLYYGDVKIQNGTYEKDGETKNRYHTIGKVFVSPHLSRMSILLLPTATSDERWLNAYEDEKFENPLKGDKLPSDSDIEKPVDLGEIPF